MPSRPTLPVLHGWVPAHSMQSRKSIISRALHGSMWPGERPHPRASTRTHTYPSGTHFSGSHTSHDWKRFDDPAATSGWRLHHRRPRVGVALLERQILAVGAITQHHRDAMRRHRGEKHWRAAPHRHPSRSAHPTRPTCRSQEPSWRSPCDPRPAARPVSLRMCRRRRQRSAVSMSNRTKATERDGVTAA